MKILGVFAKYWQPGTVKTRLAASIGEAAACQIYHAFLVALLGRFASLGERRMVAYSPSDRCGEFSELAAGCWELRDQGSGNLGERMSRFFDFAAVEGTERVVLIGSDSPSLPSAYLEAAWEALQATDVVLGPTEDGGYYLVGSRGNAPPIFAGIEWSTPRVWEQTLERVRLARLTYTELPKWYDVDEHRDLSRLMRELDSSTDRWLVQCCEQLVRIGARPR